MDVWRICKGRHESSAFTGYGAEKTGGRWNYRGYTVVYASETLSLATLELFVHVPPGVIPSDLVAICAHLPDSVEQEYVDPSDLPKNWRQYPAPAELQEIGTDWIVDRSSLVLRVPSAISAGETNLLINPAHAEIGELEVLDAQPFRFDPRMFIQ